MVKDIATKRETLVLGWFSGDSDDDFARSVEVQEGNICFSGLSPLENLPEHRFDVVFLYEGTHALKHRDTRVDNASDLFQESACLIHTQTDTD